jgi:hypothetical protein
MKRYITGFVLASAALVAGCGEDVSQSDLSKLTKISSQPAKQEEKVVNPFDTSERDGSAGVAPADETFGQGARIVMYSELLNQEVAGGTRGEGFGGGINTQPVRVHFGTQHESTLGQMIDNLTKYRASHGSMNPPTREEFVQECLAASMIKLPELSAGEYYAYDPSAQDIEKVMRVVKPAM